MSKISLEAKVGLLILVAAILLGGFLFILGGVSFKDDYTVYVDFDNPGSVQPGAAVRVGGVKVGTIESVEYLGGRLDPQTGRRGALVRFQLAIHRDVQDTIHQGIPDPERAGEYNGQAIFFVTSQGVLGEQFIAIEPGDPASPPLPEDAIVHGVDPPRLDLALNLGFELLETIVDAVRDNREELGEMMDDVFAILDALRSILGENQGDLNAIVDNVRTLSEEGVTTLRGAREAYIDGERPQRIMRNLDRTVAIVDRETPSLLRNANEAAADANQALDSFGPDQQRQMQNTLASAERIAGQAETAMTDANTIVRNIREGRGTVGALLADEEIYDDLQELIRDLKHNPWKFFWRE